MTFPEILDLLSGTQTVRVEPGVHTLDWSLYTKAMTTSDARLTFEAHSESLYQTAELSVRVADANS